MCAEFLVRGRTIRPGRTLGKAPSGFLPISTGNVRTESLTSICREAPFLHTLRDAANLEGKCGECEFKEIYGGSRARAYAVTGDLLRRRRLLRLQTAEPGCSGLQCYVRKKWRRFVQTQKRIKVASRRIAEASLDSPRIVHGDRSLRLRRPNDRGHRA
jgi:hypothetical protein